MCKIQQKFYLNTTMPEIKRKKLNMEGKTKISFPQARYEHHTTRGKQR